MEEDKISNMLDDLKAYFKNTPREKVLSDWAKSKEATKGINSPTISEFMAWQEIAKEWPEINQETIKREPIPVFRHSFKGLTEDEIMKDRSNGYKFLDFNNPPIDKDNENNKGC